MGCGGSKEGGANETTSLSGSHYETNPEYDLLLKILVIGDSGVGKSCMLLRFADNSFTDSYISTIGVDFKIRTIELDGKRIKLQIVSCILVLYVGHSGYVIHDFENFVSAKRPFNTVYDITSMESFNSIKKWLVDVERFASPTVLKLIVGNKSDLAARRAVDYKIAKKFADDLNIPFIETSAKDSVNIEEAFIQLASNIKRTVTSTSTQVK